MRQAESLLTRRSFGLGKPVASVAFWVGPMKMLAHAAGPYSSSLSTFGF